MLGLLPHFDEQNDPPFAVGAFNKTKNPLVGPALEVKGSKKYKYSNIYSMK
jgi:hypothetical protein